MQVNKHVIVATAIIVGGGLIKKFTSGGQITSVLMGGGALMLVLGVVDLFGGGASKLASGIAMLAAVTAIITQVPWSTIFGFLNGTKGKTA